MKPYSWFLFCCSWVWIITGNCSFTVLLSGLLALMLGIFNIQCLMHASIHVQSLYPFHLLFILWLNFLRYLCLNFTLQNVKLITKILYFSGTLEINCSKDIKVQGVIGPCTSLEKVGQFDHLEVVLHILRHI